MSAAFPSFPIWLATAGGLGYAPRVPGTAGAAGGVALFLLMAPLGLPLYLVTAIGIGALGIWAADAAERHFQRVDDGRVVIDEVSGQLLALLPLVAGWPEAGTAEIAGVVTGFVAFRVFDVWKPGPVGWAERRFGGGVGVMADDWVAGGLAALTVVVAMAVAGGPQGA